MVCDLTSRASLDSLLKYWRHQVQLHALPRAKVILVANKSDVTDGRAITENQVQDAEQELNCVFSIETSAVTHEGVSELLRKIADLALEDKMSVVQPEKRAVVISGSPRQNDRARCC
jgi:GTPase SAR1 family protein